jgi:hypothetical protein
MMNVTESITYIVDTAKSNNASEAQLLSIGDLLLDYEIRDQLIAQTIRDDDQLQLMKDFFSFLTDSFYWKNKYLAPIATLTSMFCYFSGETEKAETVLTVAKVADPDFRLGVLFAGILSKGVPAFQIKPVILSAFDTLESSDVA